MNAQRPSSVPPLHFHSWDRLSEYANRNGKILEEQLGYGIEGLVYATDLTAIKSYRHRELYEKERDVYFRLSERDIHSVEEFTIPRLVGCSDELWIVEMSIVSPPFILDFAGAYLDKKPPFTDEEIEEWETEKIEQFGERWPEVCSALAVLRGYGIYLSDVKPGNIGFPDE